MLLRNLGSICLAFCAYEDLDNVTLICLCSLGRRLYTLFTHCVQGEGLRMDSLNAAWYERLKRNAVITTPRLSDNIPPMIWHSRSAGFGKGSIGRSISNFLCLYKKLKCDIGLSNGG